MIISVASGKGGTGKTTIATNLARALSDVQLIDCDVQEPNAHIFIKPDILNKQTVSIPVPEVDPEKCNLCGRCQEVCVYNAIIVIKNSVLVFPELCHGCGACSYFCSQKAITEIEKPIGIVEKGQSKDLEFIHGKLNVGEMLSPPVIKAAKKHINHEKIVIIDAPPGTSCPVVTTMKNTDFVLLVTEPTPFGLNDLILAVEVARKLNIPSGVIINRYDLGNEDTENYCREENIPILMKIPFKKEIASAYSQGKMIIEAFPDLKKDFRQLFEDIKAIVDGNSKE